MILQSKNEVQQVYEKLIKKYNKEMEECIKVGNRNCCGIIKL